MSDHPDWDEGYADKLVAEAVERATRTHVAALATVIAERDRYKAALEAIVAAPMVNGIPYCDSPLEYTMYSAAEAALEGQ